MVRTKKKVAKKKVTKFNGSVYETVKISAEELTVKVENEMKPDIDYSWANWLDFLYPGIELPPEPVKGKRKTRAQHEMIIVRGAKKAQINERLLNRNKFRRRLFVNRKAGTITLHTGKTLFKPLQYEVAKKANNLADTIIVKETALKSLSSNTTYQQKHCLTVATNAKEFKNKVVGSVASDKSLSKDERRKQLQGLGVDI